MQGADLSAKLKGLEAAGFIQRTHYNADEGIARSYALPPHLWTQWRVFEWEKIV